MTRPVELAAAHQRAPYASRNRWPSCRSINVVLQELVPGDISLKDHLKPAFADGVAAGVAALTARPQDRAGTGRAAHLRRDGRARRHLGRPDRRPAGGRRPAGHRAAARRRRDRTAGPTASNGPRPTTAAAAGAHPQQLPAGADPARRTDLAFLDFDGYCRSEPGLDLALFRTTLCRPRLRALDDPRRRRCRCRRCSASGRLSWTACARPSWTATRRSRRWTGTRLALWDALTGAKDIVDCWRKVKFEHLDRRMEFLRQRLRA